MSEYDFSQLSDRVRWLIEEKGISNSALAKAGGVKPPSITSIIQGKTGQVRADIAVRICQKFGLSIVWFALGKGAAELSDVVLVTPDNAKSKSCVAIRPLILSSDPLSEQSRSDNEEHIEMIYVDEDWFKAKGLSEQSCGSYKVTDNGMAPLIRRGDIVLVDAAKKDVEEGQIYLVRFNDFLAVRRVKRTLKGGLIVSGNDPDSREEFAPSETSSVEIIGAVIYRSGCI